MVVSSFRLRRSADHINGTRFRAKFAPHEAPRAVSDGMRNLFAFWKGPRSVRESRDQRQPRAEARLWFDATRSPPDAAKPGRIGWGDRDHTHGGL